MSRIELSPTMANTVSANMLRIGSSTQPANANSTGMPLFASGSSISNSYGRIIIMAGEMPTDTAVLTAANLRSTDQLVTFDSRAAGITMTSTRNVTTFSFNYVNATKAGQATWFWWQSANGSSSTILYHSIIGSIGLLGSNADLEVNDTNVIVGNPYRITNMRITWPTTLDW